MDEDKFSSKFVFVSTTTNSHTWAQPYGYRDMTIWKIGYEDLTTICICIKSKLMIHLTTSITRQSIH